MGILKKVGWVILFSVSVWVFSGPKCLAGILDFRKPGSGLCNPVMC